LAKSPRKQADVDGSHRDNDDSRRPGYNTAVSLIPCLETNMSVPKEPPIVPIEYAGKWIAWDFQRTKIIASGRTIGETVRAAEATGEKRPIFAKAPDARVRFIGGHR
jgi:hypothetical protein